MIYTELYTYIYVYNRIWDAADWRAKAVLEAEILKSTVY